MNQKEVYRIINSVLPDLLLKHEYHTDGVPAAYEFKGLNQYRNAIKILSKTNLLPLSNKLKNKLSLILESKEDFYNAPFSSGHDIETSATTLYEATNALLNYLAEQLEKDSDENSIEVKLIKIENLDEMEKIASLLKKSFDIPVHEMGGQIAVKSLEKGSVWIILGVIAVTGTALKMCANLIWAAAAIYKKFEDVKITQEHARTIKLKNDLMEGLIKQQLEYIEESKQAEATAIANEFFQDQNNETKLRIKLSIESIGELIEKGAQFYPSIGASDEIKQLFPDFNLLNLIESKTKLLNDGAQTVDSSKVVE